MDIKETILETIQELEEESILVEDEKKECDKEFLKELRDKLLVLFEGLQSPNTENLDVKLDVTLNFLEYLLAKLEEKIDE